jgi:hypothetical protein
MEKVLLGLIIFTGLLSLFSNSKENFQGEEEYLEIKRGNLSLYNYPPCFHLDDEAEYIYDFLKETEILKGSYNLINCLSMIICQRMYSEQKKCDETMLQDRIRNLADLGFKNIYTNEYIKYNSMAYTFISTEHRLKMSQSAKIFVTGTTMLIQNNLEELSKLISKKEYENLQKKINTIYKNNFPIIAKNC